MPKATNHFLISGGVLFSLITWLSVSMAEPDKRTYFRQQRLYAAPPDTTKKDSLSRDRRPTLIPRIRYGDPYSSRTVKSPLILNNPSNIKTEISADSGGNVTVQEKVGSFYYRQPTTLTFREFSEYQDEKLNRDYWRSKSESAGGKSEVTGRGLIPKIYISPVFDRIFGGNYIDFQTNGFVNLDFGMQYERVGNPNMSVRQQRTFLPLNFDQQISLNAVGKVGEKLKLTANFDTKASFQFEQDLKLEYTGYEEDIIQKIEAGNVSMPLNSTLITGAQNLFGLKTQLRFGRLNVTSILANQRARMEQIQVQGGVQKKRFEIRASEYELNRHFFLGQFFRNGYETSLRALPLVNSGIIITRLEVYVTNRNNTTQSLRNFIAFTDLGEATPSKDLSVVKPTGSGSQADNGVNNLYRSANTSSGLRDATQTSNAAQGLGLTQGVDFEILRSARKLDEREYTFQPQLGYLSLSTALRPDDILAVAFEYTLNGRKYKVGELTEDYQTRPENQTIILKLLHSSTANNQTDKPIWDLMMKNVYSLGAAGINREGFQFRAVYKDDLTGIDNPSLQEGSSRVKDVPLVQLFNLDRLNPQGDPQPDGNFDWIEGITIDSRNGRVVFPVLEPFGRHLERVFDPETPPNPRTPINPAARDAAERALIDKYVFSTLYRSTQQEAQTQASKNKFFLKGSYQSTASNEVQLPTIGADENAIRSVTLGGQVLTLGQDYTVEGGKVVLSDALRQSNASLNIEYERPDLFNNQTRTLFGTRLDYQINKDFVVGSTLMRLRERPILTRVGLGNEPTNNTIFGLDANFKKDSRFLTRLVDLLPLIETKEISTISFSGEYAKLFPSVAPLANGNSFIDDFEGAELPFDLTRQPQTRWKLGSTPQMFANANSSTLEYGYQRAKLAWYNVDNTFYRGDGLRPSNITEAELKNHYVRSVSPNEIFPQRNLGNIPLNEPILDLAYYPAEKGMYNYNPNFASSPVAKNFASLTRAITYDTDFDNANIQYIEFWLMDPFIPGDSGRVENIDGENRKGGFLYFNLGNISEDVIPDNQHTFENGFPSSNNASNQPLLTDWGKAPTQQYLTNAFDNTGGTRSQQDIGLDGLNNAEEQAKFPNTNQEDPANDDFVHFLSPRFDGPDGASILNRYKNYNGMDGNSPEAGGQAVPQSNYSTPDNEDLNTDNTIINSQQEQYFQYKVDLRKGNIKVGQKYIVDQQQFGNVTWYQFRIPIREYTEKVGNIEGFKSIRFIRMFMTGFTEPTILRMAQFQMVANQWRTFNESLYEKGLQRPEEPYDARFTVGTVNVEENSQSTGGDVPYLLPPGFIRDRDITTINQRTLNEQSLKLCVEELRDKDSRAIFKNVSLDFINYKRIRMFIHADSRTAENGDVSAFLRLGTDYTDNYYEIEKDLTITRTPLTQNITDPEVVWPKENEIDVPFARLVDVKSNRNRTGQSVLTPYSDTLTIDGQRYRITVVGNPDLSSVQTIMIGVRNPAKPGETSPKSVCIWVNELRTTDFDQESGWAATGRMAVKLADFATVTASARHMTYGFGGIQDKISERARETTTQWDIASNINLDKLLPGYWGLKVPMFISYERERVQPRFNPLDPDVKLTQSIDSRFSKGDKDNKKRYRRQVEDNTTRRSINFTNVQKVKINPNAKNHLWDIENLSLTYAYTDVLRTDPTTDLYLQKNYRGGVGYAYTSTAKPIEPFKNIKALGSPWLKWLQEFNFSLAPSSIAIRGDLDRMFTKTQLRNLVETPEGYRLSTLGIAPTYEKYFRFDRTYDIKWNLTKNLSLDYTATANAIFDEPAGDINNELTPGGITKRDSLINSIRKNPFGRMKNFQQQASLTYRVPLDKFPLTDWLNADIRYATGYRWTASAVGLADTLGNFMENNRSRTVNGRIDLTRLYNKVRFLKAINEATPKRPATPTGPNRPNPANPNQAAAQDTTAKKPELKVLKGIIRTIMTARNITFTYSLDESTALPGFKPSPHFFGLDSAFRVPGLPFTLLGSQDGNIRHTLAEKGLLSTSQSLNTPFSQTLIENITVRTDLEPFRDFKIRLDAKRSRSANYSELFRFIPPNDTDNFIRDNAGYVSLSPNLNGDYNISFLSISTAFEKRGKNNQSAAFQRFIEYRERIQSRLSQFNTNEGNYNINSQDVLIPAFIAAYSGKDVDKVKLSPFPKIPLPNWRVDYAGLSRVEALKSVFSSVNITHSYTSNYTVRGFTSSLAYGSDSLNRGAGVVTMTRGIEYPTPSLTGLDTTGNSNNPNAFIPVYVIDQQVIISERFAPLIGINVRTVNRITARLEYNKERNVALQLSNHQIQELANKDIVMSIGFTRNNFRLPFRVQGRDVVLKNDLTFRCDATVRDSKTVQRTTDEGSTVTNGSTTVQVKPTVNYVLNQRLNIQLYYEQMVNKPKISTSFPRTTSSLGFNLRYNLGQ